MTKKEFADGWKHFCNCISFDQSALDADAIKFMNEMPAAVNEGLIADEVPAEPEPAAEPEPEPDRIKAEPGPLNPPISEPKPTAVSGPINKIAEPQPATEPEQQGDPERLTEAKGEPSSHTHHDISLEDEKTKTDAENRRTAGNSPW